MSDSDNKKAKRERNSHSQEPKDSPSKGRPPGTHAKTISFGSDKKFEANYVLSSSSIDYSSESKSMETRYGHKDEYPATVSSDRIPNVSNPEMETRSLHVARDVGSVESDTPLKRLRERVQHPLQYFNKLSALQLSVYENSMIKTYRDEKYVSETYGLEIYKLRADSRLWKDLDQFDLMDDEIVAMHCREVARTNEALARDLFSILEARNSTAKVWSSIEMLRLDGFCSGQFNFLVADRERPNIAILKSIDRSSSDMPSIQSQSLDGILRVPFDRHDIDKLGTRASQEVLTQFGLIGAWNDSEITIPAPFSSRTAFLYSLTSHIVDFALVSYVGAHVARFDREFIEREMIAIDIMRPWLCSGERCHFSIMLSQRSLRCLDEFHGNQNVWVFSSGGKLPLDKMFLSCKVEEFADIWGPLWKKVDDQQLGTYKEYVGNGTIVKW